MKSNILAFFFTIGSIAMAVLIIWFYNMSDRVAPEMRFVAMDLTYTADTEEKDLMSGVMAYDDRDGDITDRIVIEKTILNEESSTAVVYYAVSDLSGNVTKQSRVFPADLTGFTNAENAEEDMTFPEGFLQQSEDGEIIEGEITGEGEDGEEGTQEGAEGEDNSSEEGSQTDGE